MGSVDLDDDDEVDLSPTQDGARASDIWGHEKANKVKALFYEYLNHVRVNSKEDGWIILGHHLYEGQNRVIDQIFDGLAVGIHDFKILKSRQLGISTIIRSLLLFWTGIFDGVTGSLVFDTAQHLEEARTELVNMLDRFDEDFSFPRKKKDNRYSLELDNVSRVNLAAAGVRASSSGGTLGRGSGISVAHLSEICSYGNVEGLEAYRNALARKNPNRLYIYESTARGLNIWFEIWEEAELDPHCRCIFVGWWSHKEQTIERGDPDFERYGLQPPTERELRKIREVKELYDYDVSPEQLAWIRREMAPTAEKDGDADVEYEGSYLRVQEQPWTAKDAFQQTGHQFFATEILDKIQETYSSKKYTSYWFSAGAEFIDMKVHKAFSSKDVQLKVWEQPEVDGVYVIAADPAFGIDEENDRSAIQVLRCYADGVDQVAEYANPLITARQFAWVIMALAAWYGAESDRSQVYLILELNGPGYTVWDEIQSLKKMILNSYLTPRIEEKGLQDIFRNVRNFFYSRPDSIGTGKAIQWKTSPGPGPSGKVRLMERARDFVHSNMVRIRSVDTLDEMRRVTREGDSIAGQGKSKDDRVLSLAMALRCWEDKARKFLMPAKMTRAAVEAKKALSIVSLTQLYSRNQLDTFFQQKRAVRQSESRALMRAAWRGRR